jgi:hypothetical protein
MLKRQPPQKMASRVFLQRHLVFLNDLRTHEKHSRKHVRVLANASKMVLCSYAFGGCSFLRVKMEKEHFGKRPSVL